MRPEHRDPQVCPLNWEGWRADVTPLLAVLHPRRPQKPAHERRGDRDGRAAQLRRDAEISAQFRLGVSESRAAWPQTTSAPELALPPRSLGWLPAGVGGCMPHTTRHVVLQPGSPTAGGGPDHHGHLDPVFVIEQRVQRICSGATRSAARSMRVAHDVGFRAASPDRPDLAYGSLHRPAARRAGSAWPSR